MADAFLRAYSEKFNMMTDLKTIEVVEAQNRQIRKLKRENKALWKELMEKRTKEIAEALEDRWLPAAGNVAMMPIGNPRKYLE